MTVAIQIDKATGRLIDCLERRITRQGLYSKIDRFFAREASRIAGVVIRESFGPGKAIQSRTGTLARSVQGRSLRIGGRPALQVGILQGPALRYAGVLEFGTKGENKDSPYPTIRPRKAKALAIPVNDALTASGVARYQSPRDYPQELVRVHSALYVEGKDDPDVDEPVYLLRYEVDIKPKRYLRDPAEREADEMGVKIAEFLGGELDECAEIAA